MIKFCSAHMHVGKQNAEWKKNVKRRMSEKYGRKAEKTIILGEKETYSEVPYTARLSSNYAVVCPYDVTTRSIDSFN